MADVTLGLPGHRDGARRTKRKICARWDYDSLYRPTQQAELAERNGVSSDLVEEISPTDNYELILVAVKSNQVDALLPTLHDGGGSAHIVFFQNNWRGAAPLQEFLSPVQYLFGFSRMVGGWRTENAIECMISSSPGMSTIIGEADGAATPRLARFEEMLRRAKMKPEISHDILGWLATHYVEYLGAVGGILQAGSAHDFAENSALVREAILATREGLDVCRARGIDVGKTAPVNLRLYGLPLMVIVPIGQKQYRSPDIQRFFQENIAHGMDEIAAQYFDVLYTGEQLRVPMPHLKSFERYFAPHQTKNEQRLSDPALAYHH